MLTASLIVPLILIGLFDDRPDEAPRLRELIRSKSATPKTLVFLYEGRMQWIGDPKLVGRTDIYDDEYQGTFLYRSDGAALYDLYHKNPSSSSGVIRKKASVLKGRWETSADMLDRVRIGPSSIQVSRGTINSFHPYEGPNDLFPVWGLEELMVTPNRKTTAEGWDQVDGRNCLRLRVGLTNTDNPEFDQRLFWVDLERGAQVVKVEFYTHSKLATSIDDIHFYEITQAHGPPYWLPVSSRRRIFVLADAFYSTPLLERTVTVVGGSARIDIDLSDSSFSVTNDSALPAPGRQDGDLRKNFEAQPIASQTPPSTDPASVRKRIEGNLAEADRQSKQLEASSATRDPFWGRGIAQTGFVAFGIACLAAAFVWMRRSR